MSVESRNVVEYVLLNHVFLFNKLCYLRYDDYFTNSKTNVRVVLEYEIHVVSGTEIKETLKLKYSVTRDLFQLYVSKQIVR